MASASADADEPEKRRLAAAWLLRGGRRSQAVIARRLGVSEATVSRWQAQLAAHGRVGLRRRPHIGRHPKLTEAQ